MQQYQSDLSPEYKGGRNVLTSQAAICKVCSRLAICKITNRPNKKFVLTYACEEHSKNWNPYEYKVQLFEEYRSYLNKKSKWEREKCLQQNPTLI